MGRVVEQLEIDSLVLLNEIKSERFSTAVKLSSEELLSFFLPNSYEMYWNISAADFCDRMRVENDRFWDGTEKKSAKLKLSRAEVISLAAIVNEESKKVDGVLVAVYLNFDYEGA